MVKGLNNDAVAIKMVDNPPDLQAVIPNEIIIISSKKKKNYFLSITYSTVVVLKYTVDSLKL